ncbi:hypothetical protein IPN35_06020 [Candidatus Peregrinibacteria bacterium]|nr:MAG: hypothetical protein IPN35_06020 [Candidatus Peregrinibacteria bacterium]
MEESIRQHVRQIALRELSSGRSPNEVFHLAEKAGISQEYILEDLGTVLAENPDAPFASALQNLLHSIRESFSIENVSEETKIIKNQIHSEPEVPLPKNEESTHFSENITSEEQRKLSPENPLPELGALPLPFLNSGSEQLSTLKTQQSPQKNELIADGEKWDIIGEKITDGRFASSRKMLEEKLESYQKNPMSIRRNTILFALPALITILAVIFHPSIIGTLLNASDVDDDGTGIYLLILPFVPIVLYIGYVLRVQRRLIKMLVAKTRNWVFSPDDRRERWQGLVQKYPEIFQKGNKDQNVQEEFWGSIFYEGKEMRFWMGVFEYVVESNSRKSRSRTKHLNTVFALPLNKKLASDFRLEPEGIGLKILNSLFRRNEEIETESVDFNSAYAVFYNGKKLEKELEIVKTLSPSVQVRLVQLSKKWKATILFRENAVLFSLKGRFLSWRKMKTNFFRKIELDSRDQELLENQILEFVHLSGDITPFLD